MVDLLYSVGKIFLGVIMTMAGSSAATFLVTRTEPSWITVPFLIPASLLTVAGAYVAIRAWAKLS